MPFIICVDWRDGPTEDTDEILVVADSEDQAVVEAERQWRQRNQQWPTIEFVAAWPLRLDGTAKAAASAG